MLNSGFCKLKCVANRLYDIDNKKVVMLSEVIAVGKAG